jgi:hypothetical protein
LIDSYACRDDCLIIKQMGKISFKFNDLRH